MKILIVGAGLGSLSLANFLNDSAVDYEIIEKSADWAHQGYALSLWNNGRNILKKLGLAEVFDKNSTRIQNYYIYDGVGNLLRKHNLSDFYSQYGMALSLVSRSLLHSLLMEKIGNSKVKMNLGVESIVQKEDRVSVGFSNGEFKDYDLVVGADGIHSKVRSLIFKKEAEINDDWRVWYTWIDNKYKGESSVIEYLEPEEFISIFDGGEKTLAIISAPANHTIWDNVSDRIERLSKAFVKEKILVPQIFENLKSEEIIPFDLLHIHLKKWWKDRVVLLGDAAHGFEPHGGIGGSMALEDGYVLASELMQVSPDHTLYQALDNYETKRKKRIKIAYNLTRKISSWTLVKSKTLRKLINLIIPYFPVTYFTKDYQKLFNEEI